MYRIAEEPICQRVTGQRHPPAACRSGYPFHRLPRSQREVGRGDDLIQPIAGSFKDNIQRVENMINVVPGAPRHQVAHMRSFKAGYGHANGPHGGQNRQRGQVVDQRTAAIAAPVGQKPPCGRRIGQGDPSHVPDFLRRADLVEQANIPDRGII